MFTTVDRLSVLVAVHAVPWGDQREAAPRAFWRRRGLANRVARRDNPKLRELDRACQHHLRDRSLQRPWVASGCQKALNVITAHSSLIQVTPTITETQESGSVGQGREAPSAERAALRRTAGSAQRNHGATAQFGNSIRARLRRWLTAIESNQADSVARPAARRLYQRRRALMMSPNATQKPVDRAKPSVATANDSRFVAWIPL
jgi:hypothetical protein